MAGPSLQLGVNAAGQDTLAGLNAELVKLRTNLGALKGVKADLSGLASANADLQQLRAAFAETSSQLRPTFTAVAQTVRGGFAEIASETVSGAARATSAIGTANSQIQAEYEKSIGARNRYTQAEVDAIRTGGLRIAEAERAAATARAAAVASSPATTSVRPVIQGPVVTAPQAPGLTDELGRMRTSLSDGIQGLRTGFAELAEAIKGGLVRASTEASTGGARVRSIVAQERQQLQAEYEKAISDRRVFTQEELAVIRDAGVRLIEADRQMLAARAAANATNRVALGGGAVSNPLPPPPRSVAPATEIDAAYAQHARSMAQEAAQIRASEWERAQAEADQRISRAQQQGFALFSANEQRLAAERARLAGQAAKADTSGLAAADAYAASVSTAAAREAAAQADWIAKMQVGSARIAEAQERAAATIAAAEDARRAKLMVGSAAIAEAQLAAAAKEASAQEAWIAKMQVGSAKIAEQVAVAAQREVDALAAAAEKIARAEAAYQAAGARQQAATQVRARAQLDQGISEQVVQANYGPTAASAAQAASSLRVLQEQHKALSSAAAEATPKVTGLSAAMKDLHSASRGVASGFDAMFLTWGNIVPLLAGAALSNAFVQTVKLGAEVNQQLGLIKILAGESDASVAGLNKQLLDMASNGQFGPKELAEAFKNLTLAGLTIKEQKSAIGDVVNFAIAGTTTIEHASEALVQISTAFGYTANGFGRVGDVIAKAAAISLSSVETLTKSMQAASEVHTLYGQSLVDVATNLATLSQLGIRGTAAGTALKNMYAELSGSTSIVRKNIQAYNLDLLDENGKVKGLIPLLETLSGKYNSLKGAAQTRFIQDLSNSRGGKDMAALLIEYNKIDADGQAKLAKTQQQIAQSYGFSAIAAATLAVTAKNQMASVSASFQASLVKSFDAIEPSIISISGQLRGIFNSSEFQTSVQNLAVTVANVATTLLSHIDLIKQVVEAYVAWKVVTIGMAVIGQGFVWLQAAGGWVTTLSAAFRTNTVAVTANAAATRSNALAAEADALAIQAEVIANRNAAIGSEARAVASRTSTAAAEANTIATEANAVAAATAGRAAASAGSLLLRSIPVIGAIALAGSFAMDLFWNSASGKKANVEDSFDEKAKQVLEKLKQQTDLAKANWTAMTGVGDTSKGDAQVAGQEYLNSLETKVQQRGDALTAAKKKLEEQTAAFNRPLEGVSAEDAALAQSNRASTKDAENAVASAESQYRSALQLKNDMVYQLKQLNTYSEGAAKAADSIAAQRGKVGTGDTPKKPDTAAAGSELNSLLTIYHAREAAVKAHFDAEEKIETAYHQAGMISDIQYQIESEANLQASYDKRLDLTNQFIAQSRAALAVLEADPKKNAKAITVQAKVEIDLTKERDQLMLAKELLDVKRQGREFKQEEDISKFISQQMQSLVLDREKVALNQSLEAMTNDQRVIAEARLLAEGKFTDEIRKQQVELAKTQAYLTSLQANKSAANDYGAGDPTKIEAAQAAVERLQGGVDRLVGAAATASQVAAETAASALVPSWQKMLNGWRNTTQVMANAYDEMMTGILNKGQDIFTRLLKTGKLTAGELIDVVRDAVSKEIYQRAIAPGLAQVGNQLATTLFGARPTASTGGVASPIDLAAQNTTASLTTLNDVAVNPLINIMTQLMSAAEQAASALFNIGGSGGGGGGGFLSGLFGNNTGDGSAGWTGNTVGDTTGVVGDTAVSLFAKGSVFSNRVFSQPTNFHFANGSGFSRGQMAEAGPEAVMPLKRGLNGSLGVALHDSAAQSSSNVSVVIENHSGANARVQETKKSDGTREIRAIIDQVKGEMVRDVHSGGDFAGAIESQYGVSRTSGIPRR